MDPGFIHLTIVSGSDIKRGSFFGADKKVAVAWVDPKQKRSTKASEGEASNPQWNDKLTLPLVNAGRTLTIEIRSKGGLGESLLGTVHIPVADIAIDGTKEANKKLTYLVERPSGRRDGSLNLFAKIVRSPSNSVHPIAASPVIAPLLYPPVESYFAEQSLTAQPYPPAESYYPPPYPPSHPAPGTVYPPAESYLAEQSQTARPYPPAESYLAEQLQTVRPYPPAESLYPPPYPPSQAALDTVKPTHPVSNRPPPPYWSSLEYSYAPPQYDCCHPAPSPFPAHENSLAAYPPAVSHEYPVTAYPPTAPYYPPAKHPSSQHYSYDARYPPLCAYYPYPYSYGN